MKQIVYVVYHNLNTEARSMEFLKCMTNIGHVHIITLKKPDIDDDIDTYLVDKSSPIALLKLIRTAKKVIKKVQPDIVLLHDNDCSVLLPYIKKHSKKSKIIYDSSELYIKLRPETAKNIKKKNNQGFIFHLKEMLTFFRSYCEKKYLNIADLVFAANEERAKIMKDYYKLDKLPEIYDNMHRIDDSYDLNVCRKKFDNYFNPNAFNILFGGGINSTRGFFEYLDAFRKLDKEYNLVVAGGTTKSEYETYLNYIKLNGMEDRVHYVGFVTRGEFKYIIQNCQASVIMFSYDNYNSLNCASGKMYEGLFEGVPILAAENPPLKRICKLYSVGVSNDNYVDAILEMRRNYSKYKDAVQKYVATLDYDTRLQRLEQVIKLKLCL